MRCLNTKLIFLGICFFSLCAESQESSVLRYEQMNLRLEGLNSSYDPVQTLTEFTAVIQPSAAGSVSSWNTAYVKVTLYSCDSIDSVDVGPSEKDECVSDNYTIYLDSDFRKENIMNMPGRDSEIMEEWGVSVPVKDELISLKKFEKYYKIYGLSGDKLNGGTGAYHMQTGFYALRFEYGYSRWYHLFDDADYDVETTEAYYYFQVTTKGMEGGYYTAISFWLSVLEDEGASDFTLKSAWDALKYYTGVSFLHHTQEQDIEERRRAAKEYRLWWEDKKDQLVLTIEEDGSEYLNDPSIKSGFFYKGINLINFGNRERTTFDDSVLLEGEAVLGAKGMRSLTAYNSQLPDQHFIAQRPAYREWKVSVPLAPGMNTITLIAEDNYFQKKETIINVKQVER